MNLKEKIEANLESDIEGALDWAKDDNDGIIKQALKTICPTDSPGGSTCEPDLNRVNRIDVCKLYIDKKRCLDEFIRSESKTHIPNPLELDNESFIKLVKSEDWESVDYYMQENEYLIKIEECIEWINDTARKTGWMTYGDVSKLKLLQKTISQSRENHHKVEK